MLTIEPVSNIDEFRKMINPFKKEWINVQDTNCYSYSIGLDAPLRALGSMYFNNPGGISNGSMDNPFTIEELLTNLELDLKALGISYIEVNPDFIINRERFKGEWKISVMGIRQRTPDFSPIYNDFHFLRQTESGIWTHKKGYRNTPTNLDSYFNEITDPIKARIETDGFFSSERYDYIKTYCLKK